MIVLHFITTIIVFGPVVSSLSPKEFPFLKTKMNDQKHAVVFNKLLDSIVRTNQKRLDAIKKLTKLQKMSIYPSLEDTFNTLRTGSRKGSEESSSESDEKNIIYLVIPETPVINASNTQNLLEPKSNDRSDPKALERSQQNVPTLVDYSQLKSPNPPANPVSSSTSQIQSITKEGLDALRVSIERSCQSKEIKRCKNACLAAMSSACEEYSCKKKLKKKFKKGCKRECKEEFRSGW